MVILRNTEAIEMLAKVSRKWIVEVFGLDIDWHELEGKVLTQENCQAVINKIVSSAPFLYANYMSLCQVTIILLAKKTVSDSI